MPDSKALAPNIRPLYFVETKDGLFLETERDRSSKSQVIRDIADGQIENVVRVLEVFEDEGSVRDVTEDIAVEVRQHLYVNIDRFCEAPTATREFVERHCEVIA